MVDKVINGSLKKVTKCISFQQIPMSWSLKILLGIPGTIDLIKNYMDELRTEKNISNFIQFKLWL